MYFPYLRGRQYELIGIREAIKAGVVSSKIIPIIEPVKLSSTLLSTIKVSVVEKKEVAVICNSAIPSFLDDFDSLEKEKEKKEYLEILKNNNIIKAFLVKNNWKKELENYKELLNLNEKDIMLICNDVNFVDEVVEKYNNNFPRYNLIPEEKRFRRKITKNKILLEDRFIKEDRNSDYLKNIDDFFSEDHLFYTEDNYEGFSDYLTIGEKYVDGGFAPYAVAIHITYLDEKDNSIRIHHFVSDSNDDIKDPAKKFYEALTKLVEFKFPESSKTRALEKFYEYYENQSYPGLGSIKKLSLLHHIELVNNFLELKGKENENM